MKAIPVSTLIAALSLPFSACHATAADTTPKETVSRARADSRDEAMSMVLNLALSPDGKTMACAWDGDIWLASTTGGEARRLTQHPADDSSPVFSRDGKQIAFASKREDGVSQVFVVDTAGGTPRQVTFNTEGAIPLDWWPDAKSLLVGGARDHLAQNYRPPFRLFRVNLEQREREELLFDDYSGGGAISPDGKKILITREDHEPYRVGYRGSQSAQIWIFDLESKNFTPVLRGETGNRSPRWRPDGKGFYFLDSASGTYNVAEYDFASGKTRALTRHDTVNCYTPAISADGSTLVYRYGFDLYRLDLRKPGSAPVPVPLHNRADRERERTVRRTLGRATESRFSADGLETFFAAGGDLWVMDTTLAEPHAITETPFDEFSPQLADDGEKLYFIQNRGDAQEILVAERTDPSRYWWQNDKFKLTTLTDDKRQKADLKLSPDGKRLAFVRNIGDLVVADIDGKNARVLVPAWNKPDYSWSPDGKWITYAVEDNDFNRDVWIVPADGSAAPVNISRHPDNDSAPAWSPDGKCIVWAHERGESVPELSYVWLTRERDEASARDRKIESALEKMKKERPAAPAKATAKPAAKTEPADKPVAPAAADKPSGEAKPEAKAEPASDKPAEKAEAKTPSKQDDKTAKKLPEVTVDLEDIHRRVHNLPISVNPVEFDGFTWSSDGKKLYYPGTLDGKKGMLAMDITEDEPKPELFATGTVKQAVWLDKPKALAGTAEGLPALAKSGALTTHKFTARQAYDRVERQRVAMLDTWRLMRDHFYDAATNNRDWNTVRARYENAAANAVDTGTFDRVMNMMLGELNASHCGYYSNKKPAEATAEWPVATAHLGVRFDDSHAGPGLLVAAVIKDGPADRVKSRIQPGEIIIAIDEIPVGPKTDLTTVLNGSLARDLAVRVKTKDGVERTVVIRPESYAEIRARVNKEHLRNTAAAVDTLSHGKLGYVYVASMDWPSFRQFEKAIYEQGAGKDGLIIDVRNNGGGFTTDHLLTILCQPRHAITIPRDGGLGYPHDRHVYAAWDKPIVVLCNQNSFSNAEVFSHAVKNLGRGKVVGVRTAGGVISTGQAPILDVGIVRMPTRGWYSIRTGEDYELNGAMPDFTVWPEPGEIPAGKDRQLEKAVDVLLKDVAAVKPRPTPVNAHANGR